MPTLDPIGSSGCSRTPYGFTTLQCISNLYGSRGYENILADTGANEEQVINGFIVDAEQTVMSRLSKFHDYQDMVGDSYINSRTTWIAAYLLSKRRGNEHYFEDLYNEAMRELDAIAAGELPPVATIPQRAAIIPAMSNQIVDDRFGASKLRVRDFISVGGTYPGQHVARGYFWGWL